ncbi:MAG: TonB-dependent receptor [Pseudomonadota bacterium]
MGLAGGSVCSAQNTARANAVAYADMTLEELGNLQVTSVSKKEERLADAAAAIYLITNDAIRRSGAQTLPEALRLAPNLQVARISAYQYAITARGFNSSTANKLLVLIDGRAIYAPLYSGVFWDAQDVLLQDVDRIEVISGPGGTLWGANAVNGVINIITRQAQATDGALIHASAGGTANGLAFRHGAAFGDGSGAYRVYGKVDRGLRSVRADDSSVADAWDRTQTGFRADWRGEHNAAMTVQGDAYRGAAEQTGTTGGQQQISGGNLLARWSRASGDGSAWRVQTYLDHTRREVPGSFSEKLNTLDIDVQYSLLGDASRQWIWGGGYRLSDDDVGNTQLIAFLPPKRQLRWANLYGQMERAFRSDLRLTTGVKLESNEYTGVEVLPSVKLAWKPSGDTLLWSGLSRAVRAPSRIDTEFFSPAAPPYVLAGGPNFRSEIATTLEFGWRAQPTTSSSYSVVAFRSNYEYLRSLDSLPNGAFVLGNNINGQVDGLEAWGSYQVTPSWSLDAGLQLLNERFGGPSLALSPPGNDPRAQWLLRSRWNISESQQFDVALRHVDALPTPAIPAYTAVDVRYGWRLSKPVELAVVARNLLDPRHQEFAPPSSRDRANPVLIPRTIDVTLTVRF